MYGKRECNRAPALMLTLKVIGTASNWMNPRLYGSQGPKRRFLRDDTSLSGFFTGTFFRWRPPCQALRGGRLADLQPFVQTFARGSLAMRIPIVVDSNIRVLPKLDCGLEGSVSMLVRTLFVRSHNSLRKFCESSGIQIQQPALDSR